MDRTPLAGFLIVALTLGLAPFMPELHVWEKLKMLFGGELYSLCNLPHIDQVYLIFRSRLLDLDFAPGQESLDAELCAESEIPWTEMAFPVIKETLSLYFRDRAGGGFRLRSGDIVRVGGDIRQYRIDIVGGD